jgi:thioredoxin reductase
MLGCRIRENGEIAVDDRGRASAPGVYAAGDAVTAIHQVVLAAATGVRAAMAINQDHIEEDVRAMSR